MKNILMLLSVLLYQQLTVAQCLRKWSSGDQIGRCFVQAIPPGERIDRTSTTVTAGVNAVINFSIRFDDSDKVENLPTSTTALRCTGQSSDRVELPNAAYRIIFTIDDTQSASFVSVTSSISQVEVTSRIIAPGQFQWNLC